MTDAEYILKIADYGGILLQNTPEGAAHTARLRQIAARLDDARVVPLHDREEYERQLLYWQERCAAAESAPVVQRLDVLTDDQLVREIQMQLRPYEPISEEKVREQYEDIRQGIAIYLNDRGLADLLGNVAGVPCRFCLGPGNSEGRCPDCGKPDAPPKRRIPKGQRAFSAARCAAVDRVPRSR